MMDFLNKIIRLTASGSPLLSFRDLLKVPVFEWVLLGEGVEIRILPTTSERLICIQCKMKKGAILKRHRHDYLEGFVITQGLVKDNVSGIVMKADGKVHKWRKGTAHEPEALEYSEMLIFCEI